MATYYAITGGGNWSAAGTWNTASAQAVGNAPNAPLVGDTAIIDSFSGAVTVNTNSCVCAIMNAGGSANALTISASCQLTITGGATSLPVSGVAGSGLLIIGSGTTTCALTTNGATIAGPFTTAGSGTKTLTGNLIVNGLFTKSSAHAISGAGTTMTLANGITLAGTSTGTTKYIITGGTWQGNFNLSNSIDLQGNVTISGTVAKSGGTLTYISGTITTTSSTFVLAASTTLLTDAGGGSKITFNAITCNTAAGVYTLTSDLTLTGLLSFAGASSTFNGAFKIYSSGGISCTGYSYGTATLELTAGSWTGSGPVYLYAILNGNITFGTVAGALPNIAGSILYTSGVITIASDAVRIYGGGPTQAIDTSGMTWGWVTIHSGLAAEAMTLTGNFNCSKFQVNDISFVINGMAVYTTNFTLQSSRTISGTTNIHMSGGTWDNGAGAGSFVANSVTIDGNTTMSNPCGYKTGTLLVSAGTLTPTETTILGSCNFNTPTTNWGTINLSTASATLTLNANLSCTLLSVSASAGIAGAYSLTATTFRQASGTTFTQATATTLVASTNLYINGADNTTTSYVSATPSTPTVLTYNGKIANQKIFKATMTDITATNLLYDYQGTVTRCTNIVQINGQNVNCGGLTLVNL